MGKTLPVLILWFFLFLAHPFLSGFSVFARDPFPTKERVLYMVAPQMVEDPYGNGPATDPETMLHTDGTRSDIVSFGCVTEGGVRYLNDISIDSLDKATAACALRHRGYSSVVKPILKNNKNVSPGEEKYDANGYNWPIGNFLGRHPKAAKRGWDWVTPLVYGSLYGADLRSSRCQGGVCTGCAFKPSGPESTWVRLTRTKDALGNPVNQECFAPPYTTSGPWWAWLVGEIRNIRGHKDLDNLAAVGIYFGVDGEGRPLKSGDNWVAEDRNLATRFYNEYIPAVVREVKALYPGKTIRGHSDSDSPFFLENDVDFHRESLASDGVHSYLYKGLGDFGWWQGFANYFWLTSSVGLGQGWPPMYQTALAALSLHTDAITGIITGDLYDSGKKEGEFLKFFGSYVGKDINNTPGVWTLLRETINKKEALNNVSGKYGDYDYFLYRPEDLDKNHTVPVPYPAVRAVAPETASQIFTKASNPIRTMGNLIAGRKVAPGSRYMSFDVDDGYRDAGRVSSFDIRIVYLDMGNESFAFQYKDGNGVWQEKVINKTNSRLWQEVEFTITGAFFNNNASEGVNAQKYPTDFRLDFGLNPTIIHLVEARGRGGPFGVQRPKAQVSCDIVRNENDDPKEGIYSVGLNQELKVKAVLTDQEGRPLANERVMFTYNTEWNLAQSATTDERGVAFATVSMANRQDSSGFVGAGDKTYKYSIYSFQVLYPGGSRFHPSRNDCRVAVTSSRGVNDPANSRIKVLGVGLEANGKVRVRYQITDLAGRVVAEKEGLFGKAEGFYVSSPGLQTFPIFWADSASYHAAFTNLTVRGTGSFPTVPPIATATPRPGVSPTPIFLTSGWNEISWQSNYPSDRKFSDVPDACPIVEVADSNFWRVFVKGYGGEDLGFERGRKYFIKCEREASWSFN